MDDSNLVQQEWRKTLGYWSTTLFIDSPQGKTVFACGAALVLRRLGDNFAWDEMITLAEDLEEFCAAYLAESEELRRDWPDMPGFTKPPP
jgi:hypothetical protein